ERYRDLDLLGRYRSLTAGLQTDVVYHTVAHLEVCTENLRRNFKRPCGSLAGGSINFDIRGRVDTRGDLGSTESRWARGASHVGILGEDVVHLNLDIPDIVKGRSHR